MGAVQQLPAARHRQPDLLAPKSYRIIKDDDIPWMADLARRRYPGNYDMDAAEMWVRNIVLKQPMVFFPTRSDNAFMITLVTLLPWLPGEPEAQVVMLCDEEGAVWESVKLARASLDWAIRRNCFRWGFNSDTQYDVGPIARRLGFIQRVPRYVMHLK